MKKLIGVTSIFVTLACAFALANGDSYSDSSSDRSTTMRTCTDANGVIIYRGSTNFDRCVQARHKANDRERSGISGRNNNGMGGAMDSNPSLNYDPGNPTSPPDNSGLNGNPGGSSGMGGSATGTGG